MINSLILGIIQGVAEWLPISSEGLLVLVQTQISGGFNFKQMVSLALFLHLGTFLAALIYFKKDVFLILQTFLRFSKAREDDKKLLLFLFTTTLISGILGFSLVLLIDEFSAQSQLAGRMITFLIGIMLLFTGVFQIKAKDSGLKKDIKDLRLSSGLILGVIQGFAALPGFSRSGSTVSALILLGFKKDLALKLSFLMSLPIVLFGNIIINLKQMAFSAETLTGVLASFIFGLLTISWLLKLARKINFGYFVLAMGILTLISLAF